MTLPHMKLWLGDFVRDASRSTSYLGFLCNRDYYIEIYCAFVPYWTLSGGMILDGTQQFGIGRRRIRDDQRPHKVFTQQNMKVE